MYMLLRLPAGIIVEAVILAKGRNRMRIAAAGFPDVIESRRSGTEWITATREPVEFDFLMSDSPMGQNTSSTSLVRASGMAIH